ncbi:MAG: hypothetical protein QXR17_06815 [Candidatus Bathyarchaeia archaeon]
MPLDLEEVKREYERAISQGGDGEKLWIPDFGANLIRVLPPPPKEKLFYKQIVIHYGSQFSSFGTGMVLCSRIKGESCAVCDFIAKLKSSGIPEALDIAKRLLPVDRFLMNILHLDPLLERDSLEVVVTNRALLLSGIRRWLAPKTVRLQLLKIILDPDYGDITDFNAGRNVVVEKIDRGGRGFVEYMVRAKPDRVPIALKDEDIPSFDDVIEGLYKTYDEVRFVMFFGEEDISVGDYIERVKSYQSQSTVERVQVNTVMQERPTLHVKEEAGEEVKEKSESKSESKVSDEDLVKLINRIKEILK